MLGEARKSAARKSVESHAVKHNRLFDKDAEGWAPKNEMDDELNKALEMFPVNQNQPMDFQMPDLSSVRRNRYGQMD